MEEPFRSEQDLDLREVRAELDWLIAERSQRRLDAGPECRYRALANRECELLRLAPVAVAVGTQWSTKLSSAGSNVS